MYNLHSSKNKRNVFYNFSQVPFLSLAKNSYFIPEDGDSEDHPNIFLTSKSVQSGFSPRLKDIKHSFPMPGNYHFRFKTSLIPGTDREKSAVAVWMDCVDDNQHVGVWRGTVFAKVTRINMDDDDDDYEFQARSAPVSAPAPAQRQQQTAPAPRQAAPQPAASDNLLGVFDEQPSSAHSSHHEGDLLGTSSAPPSGGMPHGEGSLLDMNGPAYGAGTTGNPNHDDFLGMTSQPVQTAPAPAPIPAPAPSSYGNPLAGGNNGNTNTFDKFSNNNGPFGGLQWG